jgi:hypothetical protein
MNDIAEMNLNAIFSGPSHHSPLSKALNMQMETTFNRSARRQSLENLVDTARVIEVATRLSHHRN